MLCFEGSEESFGTSNRFRNRVHTLCAQRVSPADVLKVVEERQRGKWRGHGWRERQGVHAGCCSVGLGTKST